MDNYCPSFYEWPLSIRHRMTARAVGAVRRLTKRKWVVDLHIPWLHCDGVLGTVGKPRFGRIWGAPRMSMSRRVTLPTCHPEDPSVWRQVYNLGFCPFLPVDRVPLSLQGAKKGEKATFSRQSGRWKKMCCLLIIYASCLLKMSDIHIHTPYKIFLSLYEINFLISWCITPLWPLGA